MSVKGRQSFTFMAFRWDVEKAEAIVKDRPVSSDRVDVKAWWERVGGAIAINKEYAVSAAVDLTKPVILVPIYEDGFVIGSMVIDGWHRLYKAYTLGVDRLPAVSLTADEELAVRIYGGVK